MFMFLTRSYDEGFKVFTGSGAKADEASAKDFDEAMAYSGVKDVSQACAVMFKRKGKVYVIARSMDTGRKDKNTRSILFTFCVVLDERDGDSARRIFSHLAERWGECEAFMRKCLDEKFAQEKFQSFLKDYPINAEMPSKNYVLRSVKGSAPELNYIRPSGIKRHLRFAAVYMAVIAVVVYVTSGLNYEHNIKRFVEDATVYADNTGEKLRGTSGELEALSADIHSKLVKMNTQLAEMNAQLSELQEAERELAGLYAEARSADAELELSYLRIRSMENADSREAEYLSKSSGEAADRAGEFSLRVLEKLKALREKLGM
ncbi:MAG: hypothetical protein IJR85_10560 [Synergistaceae bacterium]|nr:hypothetical protein [Synergistaceae bacterium]